MADVQMTITFDPITGALSVGGSPEILGNQVLAFGMLEAAKAAMIKASVDNERRVQPATMLPPGFPGQKQS